MNPNAPKELENRINLSTSEFLTRPDHGLILEICNIINSRTDMPKIAMVAIRKRLLSKSPRTLFLTLDLIEAAANYCGISFLNQINTQEFIQTMSYLSTQTLNTEVYGKYVKVIKFLTQYLASHRDRFPLIFELSDQLQSKGFVFPTAVQSSYSNSEKVKQDSQSTANPPSELAKQPSKEKTNLSTAKAKRNANDKTRKNLETVKEDLELINEMIDAHDPKDNVLKNDILTDLIKQARKIDKKLQEFICKIESDEELMAFSISLHDDLVMTLERYESLKAGKKAASRTVKSAGKKVHDVAVPNEGAENETASLIINDSLFAHFYQVPFTNESQSTASEKQSCRSKKTENKQEMIATPPQKKEIVDLMNLDFEENSPRKNSIKQTEERVINYSTNDFSINDPIPRDDLYLSQAKTQPSTPSVSSLDALSSKPSVKAASTTKSFEDCLRAGFSQEQGQTQQREQTKDLANDKNNYKQQILERELQWLGQTTRRHSYRSNQNVTATKMAKQFWSEFEESDKHQYQGNNQDSSERFIIKKEFLEDLDDIFNSFPQKPRQQQIQQPLISQKGTANPQNDNTLENSKPSPIHYN